MSFADDLIALQNRAPRIALVASFSQNSDYTNYGYKNKNCYLVFASHYNENTFYAQYCFQTISCLDCDRLTSSELCYECTFGRTLYNCNFLYNCFTCSDCEFGFDLLNCRNCFLCVGLRTKEYHIQNKPFSREKYKEEIARIKKQMGIKQLLAELEKIKQRIPHINMIQRNCENCMGSLLQNCKNCFYCYNSLDLEDCIYMGSGNEAVKDSCDCDNIGYDRSELLYECVGNSGNFNCNFCNACWHNSDLYHCELVFNSHHCFGCIARNHAEYEILNKKYPKEDWFKRVAEINDELKRKGIYGKWLLPPTYPYDDTVAALFCK